MQGIVYKSTGSWYLVKSEDCKWYNARIRGVFKKRTKISTNPIAVGDKVQFSVEDKEENVATITDILDRDNYIVRSSPHNHNHKHIVASNVDQVLLFATLKQPITSLGFVDRFLVAAEAWHIPAIIVFNKSDLYAAQDIDRIAAIRKVYEPLGYRIFAISVLEAFGMKELIHALTDKTTLISGPSGVGKSSFINHVIPEIEQDIQAVSDWSGKGTHTTTFAEMFDLEASGSIIDTPGIKEFGITDDISKYELSHYFPEMRRLLNDCKFNNCLHINEPGCVIKAAVVENKIAEARYLSYLNIMESLPTKTY